MLCEMLTMLVGFIRRFISVLRLVVGFAARRPPLESIFTPFAALGVMMLGLNALLLKIRQQRVIWKERPYPLNQ